LALRWLRRRLLYYRFAFSDCTTKRQQDAPLRRVAHACATSNHTAATHISAYCRIPIFQFTVCYPILTPDCDVDLLRDAIVDSIQLTFRMTLRLFNLPASFSLPFHRTVRRLNPPPIPPELRIPGRRDGRPFPFVTGDDAARLDPQYNASTNSLNLTHDLPLLGLLRYRVLLLTLRTALQHSGIMPTS